jgi:Leucine-rich repeat (LRR) protein
MNQEAIALVRRCLETQDPYLDLGSLGLLDIDFAEGTALDKLLRKCTHLQTLVLSHNWDQWDADGNYNNHSSRNIGKSNQLSYHPPALRVLTGLVTLIITGETHNKWAITDMDFVADLTALQHLDLSQNKISKISGLDKLSSLRQLNLSQNQISEIHGLDGLLSLQYLDLRFNQIVEIKGLENLVGLKYLRLYRNQIIELKGLNSLFCLKDLDVGGNQLIEIKGLENLTQLEGLLLHENQITKIKGLENLKALQLLFLLNCDVREIKGLGNLINLQWLEISKKFHNRHIPIDSFA